MSRRRVYASVSEKDKLYIKEHAGTMSDNEIAKELNLTRYAVQSIRLSYGFKRKRSFRGFQLCWDCDNATDFHKCSWVDTFTYPDGVVIENGLIAECPNFILDKKLRGDEKVKVKNIKNPKEFFETLNECKGQIELITEDGDRLNLKSKLCRYIAMTDIFSKAEIGELELLFSEPSDICKVLHFLIQE